MIRNPRILVVAGDPASCERVAYLLKRLGYRVRAEMDSKDVDGFLTKPVNLKRLRKEVTRLMAGQSRDDLGLYGRLLESQRRKRAGHRESGSA